MKLPWVEVSGAVCRLLCRLRLAEVAWEVLSIVSLILSSMWHVGCDVHQSGNRWIRSSFVSERTAAARSAGRPQDQVAKGGTGREGSLTFVRRHVTRWCPRLLGRRRQSSGKEDEGDGGAVVACGACHASELLHDPRCGGGSFG